MNSKRGGNPIMDVVGTLEKEARAGP